MTTTATIRDRLDYWNVHPVPHGYDESNYSPGPDGHEYRNDCSGYVSMLTSMHDNPYTGAMVDSKYSTPITKAELRFGDVLIALAGNGWDAGHVVMFDSWTDGAHTAYHAHEFGWGAAPAHRVVTYPYNDPGEGQDSRVFKPYRLKAVQFETPDVHGSYTVQQGDTLSGIGAKLHIDWHELAEWNGLRAPYTIFPGQVLKTTAGVINTGGNSAPTPVGPKPKPKPKVPPYPLPAGYYFGPLSGPKECISGRYPTDKPEWRAGLKEWQQRMKDRGWTITPTGEYNAQTGAVALAFKREKHIGRLDENIGRVCWNAAWTEPVT